jgi:predicted nucleic acid-binding protein
MKAYVDTSYLVAIAFGEEGSEKLAVRLQQADRLFTSSLLEAELRSVFSREAPGESCGHFLAPLTIIYANRALTDELQQVLRNGYVRGADAHHLACALFLSADPSQLTFLTLDQRQHEVAGKLGFSG